MAMVEEPLTVSWLDEHGNMQEEEPKTAALFYGWHTHS